MTVLSGWLARRQVARQAATQYRAHEAAARRAGKQLHRITDPLARATLLLTAAESTGTMAVLHSHAFGHTWTRDREWRSVAMSLLWEATVLRALADAELAAMHRVDRLPTVHDVEEAAAGVLDRIAADPRGTRNRNLIAALRTAVTPVVGERAARRLTRIGA